MLVNDYSAELLVAGRFAEKGWNVYFPHRDQGFDFIVEKYIEEVGDIIRPVQVKGKYPMEDKENKSVYGFIGKLTKIHPEMILAIPYFSSDSTGSPLFIAYMTKSQIKECSKGFKCQPASFKNNMPNIRTYFQKFFDDNGLELLENIDWKESCIDY